MLAGGFQARAPEARIAPGIAWLSARNDCATWFMIQNQAGRHKIQRLVQFVSGTSTPISGMGNVSSSVMANAVHVSPRRSNAVAAIVFCSRMT